jgi:hypothetical protein
MATTTSLRVHLTEKQAAQFIADRGIEVEVFDTEDPNGMPVGTMLLTWEDDPR